MGIFSDIERRVTTLCNNQVSLDRTYAKRREPPYRQAGGITDNLTDRVKNRRGNRWLVKGTNLDEPVSVPVNRYAMPSRRYGVVEVVKEQAGQRSLGRNTIRNKAAVVSLAAVH